MLKKTYLIVFFAIILSLISACGVQNKEGSEQSTGTNVEGSNQNSENETENNQTTQSNGEKITIYIDKNCEDAQVCVKESIKTDMSELLGNKDDIEIVYTNNDQNTELNELVGGTPVMKVSKENLSKLGQYSGSFVEGAVKKGNYYYRLIGPWEAGKENLCNDGIDNNKDGKIDGEDPSCLPAKAITSYLCKEQFCTNDSLKKMLLGYNVEVLQYNTGDGKKIYDEMQKNGITNLPFFVYNEENNYIKNALSQFSKQLSGEGYKYVFTTPGFTYNPVIEACSIDCNSSEECKTLVPKCSKNEKPNVDLFVMSYCPFGTQAEKGILPSVNLLKDKINFKVKFVDYIMHGKKEIDENTLQYCVQKEEPKKYVDYLTCFLAEGNSDKCKTEAKLNMKKIDSCIETTNKEYSIIENFNTKNLRANGRYPRYNVNTEENKLYGVSGSPTLVINGIKVQPKGRSPKAYLDSICDSFDKKPEECSIKEISTVSYDPMFGWTQDGQTAPAGVCGN